MPPTFNPLLWGYDELTHFHGTPGQQPKKVFPAPAKEKPGGILYDASNKLNNSI
jgi:hypothetical protein